MSEPSVPPKYDKPSEAGVEVRLENFEGPLDLLLYLIRKNDLDVYDIPIASITHEYLAYLDLMKDLNLDTAGEFIVMASTLMQIKAQMLLPAPDNPGEEGPDPRAELMSKLLEYQRYKEAASILSGWNERAKDTFFRRAAPEFADEDYTLRASTLDLLSAFKKILEQAPRTAPPIAGDEVPLEVRIQEVLAAVAEHGSISFEALFAGRRRRIDLIVTFMAILELIRLKEIVAQQAELFGPIQILKNITEAEPESAAAAANEEGENPNGTAGH